jgi:hypothetical protein
MNTAYPEITGDLPRTVAKSVRIPFDQYEVVVTVSEAGQILGISEIKVRKDFRSPAPVRSMDFDEYYKEE